MDRPRRSLWRSRQLSLGTVASTAVVAYGTYRLVGWAWNRWHGVDAESRSQRDDAFRHSVPDRPRIRRKWSHRRQRMLQCREEAMNAMRGFLPTLRHAMEERTNTAREALSLKQLRGQQMETVHRQAQGELWEKIKVRAVTRMVATAYAHSILYILIVVQLNLHGGNLLEAQWAMPSSESYRDRMEAYSSSHKLILQQTYKHFLDHGIESLIASVHCTVQLAMKDWIVSDPASLNISRESFDHLIQNIRAGQEQGTGLLGLLIPSSQVLDTDEMAGWILDETWDVLESPVGRDALRDCLDGTFARLRDRHWGKLFDSVDPSTATATSVSITRPLAHIVTRLKHASTSFFKIDDNPQQEVDGFYAVHPTQRFADNGYCASMELLPSVLELAEVSFN